MGTKDHHPLRDKLDTFSRRLDARVREFKDRGGLSETHEAFTEDIRKRQAFLGEKLNSAIRKGAPWDVIKYEFELGFGCSSKTAATFLRMPRSSSRQGPVSSAMAGSRPIPKRKSKSPALAEDALVGPTLSLKPLRPDGLRQPALSRDLLETGTLEFRCPTTAREIESGIDMDRRTFLRTKSLRVRVYCADCVALLPEFHSLQKWLAGVKSRHFARPLL